MDHFVIVLKKKDYEDSISKTIQLVRFFLRGRRERYQTFPSYWLIYCPEHPVAQDDGGKKGFKDYSSFYIYGLKNAAFRIIYTPKYERKVIIVSLIFLTSFLDKLLGLFGGSYQYRQTGLHSSSGSSSNSISIFNPLLV